MQKIVIRKPNYQGHGGKSKLMRDLSINVACERMITEKTDSVTLPIVELVHLIEDGVVKVTGKKPPTSVELVSALTGDNGMKDGAIVITRVKGKRAACFNNSQIMRIFEIVCAKMEGKPTLPKSSKKATGKVLPFKKAM